MTDDEPLITHELYTIKGLPGHVEQIMVKHVSRKQVITVRVR